MLRDTDFLSRVTHHIEPENFVDELLQRVVRAVKQFHEEYKSAPDTAIYHNLDQLKQQGLISESIHKSLNMVCEDLFGIKLQNRDYFLDQISDFVWQQRIERELPDLLAYVSDKKRDQAEQILRDLVLEDPRIIVRGTEYTADPTARIARRVEEDQECFWTLIPEVDRHVPGLKRGEMGVWQSRLSSDGKTAALCMLARNALFQRKQVFIATVEESEHAYEDRLDMCFSAIRRDELLDSERIARNVERYIKRGERCHIKEFSPGATRISDIRQYASLLRATTNFMPDVVLIDYCDKLAPETPSLRGDVSLAGEEIFLAFEAWLKQEQLVGWTAMQSNRSGAQTQLVGQYETGGSFKKQHIAHVVLSLNRDAKSDENDLINVHIVKNRDGVRGVTFPIHSDFSRMLFWTRSAADVAN
jgi:replicative DNA helicase